MAEGDGLVAYVTVDDLVHAVVWGAWSELIVVCTRARAPNATRTSANPEVITCLSCIVKSPDESEAKAPYQCNVPMCGDSGVCAECRKRGAR